MLKYLLAGGCNVSIPIKQIEKMLNLCMHHELVYTDLVLDEKTERAYFTCTLYTARKIKNLCLSYDVDISFDSYIGIPYVLAKNRRRYGILLGSFVAVFIVFLSQIFIWDIRVIGNNTLSEAEVIDMLADNGLKIGSKINTDVDVIENKVLIYSENISWIAININGNVAYVEVREPLSPQSEDSNQQPANLVAVKDGQIEFVEVYEGEPKVTKGQLVRQGDILVSGIYDSLPWGYRYTRAKGNIVARTVCSLRVEIPYNYYEKIYSDDVIKEKTIVFFSKPIKLYRKTRFLGATYDTIYNEDQLRFPDGTRLPLEQQTKTYIKYTYKSCNRSPEDAIDLAYQELNKQIDEIVGGGATLLKKEIAGEISDSSYILMCTLTMLENIAETVEFEVSELLEDK